MPDDDAFVWDSRGDAPPTRPPRPAAVGDDRREAPVARPARSDGEAILVPLDEWARILRQLGYLHESGRDLAESRERAARAETEASFLRERLRELRERLEKAESAVEEAAADSGPEPVPSFGDWIVRRWLERRRTD